MDYQTQKVFASGHVLAHDAGKLCGKQGYWQIDHQ